MPMITEALTQALSHHLAGRLDEAKALYTLVLDADPEQPDALHFLGVLAGQVGEVAGGLALIGRALALRPEAADIHANRANLLRSAGRSPQAEDAYRVALALQPDFAEAWTDLAGVCRARGETDQAIVALERGLAANPDLAVAAERLSALLHERGRLLVDTGRFLPAIDPLARAAALAPADADIAFLLGNALFAVGLREEAIQAYRRAAALTPDFVSAGFNLGVALGRTGRLEEAADVLTRTARIDPSQVELLDTLVLSLVATGRVGEAADWAGRTLAAKDAATVANAPALPTMPPAPRGSRERRRDVLAYGLWGADEAMIRGAIGNARLAPTVHPGWTCRVYHDATVPAGALAALAEAGAEMVALDTGAAALPGPYWRFLAADDPTVRRFLCRDCDSPLTMKERAAVKAWMASGHPFHIMRDDILQTELIPPGLWGGLAGLLPDLRPLAERFARAEGAHQEHRFLRRFVWPLIRGRVLIHDGVHPGQGRPFPDGPFLEQVGAKLRPA